MGLCVSLCDSVCLCGSLCARIHTRPNDNDESDAVMSAWMLTRTPTSHLPRTYTMAASSMTHASNATVTMAPVQERTAATSRVRPDHSDTKQLPHGMSLP